MTDHELLKLAAKAAGIVLVRWNDGGEPYSSGLGFILPDNRLWNPLTDDGDALRLAVKLGLFTGPEFFHFRSLDRFAGQDADDYTANRRAIVRAAAEIGKAMP